MLAWACHQTQREDLCNPSWKRPLLWTWWTLTVWNLLTKFQRYFSSCSHHMQLVPLSQDDTRKSQTRKHWICSFWTWLCRIQFTVIYHVSISSCPLIPKQFTDRPSISESVSESQKHKTPLQLHLIIRTICPVETPQQRKQHCSNDRSLFFTGQRWQSSDQFKQPCCGINP